MLAERCEHLLSMDISETALAQARQRLSGSSNVEFLHGGIPGDFPAGNFDLIIMSEVGYYLSSGDLKRTRDLILQALAPKGLLILVHWTHFVADYPLTGDEVHELFSTIGLTNIHANRTADYRIDVYQNS
jgi:SAM-dependent methyltransferase